MGRKDSNCFDAENTTSLQTDPLLFTSYFAVAVRRGVVDGVKFLVVVRRKIDLAKTFTFSPLQSMTLHINCLDHLSISVTQFEYIVCWGFFCLFVWLVGWLVLVFSQ